MNFGSRAVVKPAMNQRFKTPTKCKGFLKNIGEHFSAKVRFLGI